MAYTKVRIDFPWLPFNVTYTKLCCFVYFFLTILLLLFVSVFEWKSTNMAAPLRLLSIEYWGYFGIISMEVNMKKQFWVELDLGFWLVFFKLFLVLSIFFRLLRQSFFFFFVFLSIVVMQSLFWVTLICVINMFTWCVFVRLRTTLLQQKLSCFFYLKKK